RRWPRRSCAAACTPERVGRPARAAYTRVRPERRRVRPRPPCARSATMRTACGLALFLAAWAGGPACADEKSPPPPRYLSLAEPRPIPLEQAPAGPPGGRGRVLAVSPSAGPGVLVLVPGRGKSRAETELQLSMALLNVETAYWNLYGAYWALFSREQGVRF